MNIMAEIEKFTSKVTDKVTSQAKTSAITTLNDPEFKATINKFTRDWFEEHKLVLTLIVGSFITLSIMAIINIVSNFRSR